MSTKQLLNEGSLSYWDRQNSLYLEEVCGIKLWSKSKKWFLLWEAVMKGAGEHRKQGGPRASKKAPVTSSIISAFNLCLSAILMRFKKIYNKEVCL